MLINKKIKAFTVFELLITMTLTGILVAFAFTGFNLMQRLFNDYTKQSNFIAEINQLHSALFYLSDQSSNITKQDDKNILFKTDSSSTLLSLNEKTLLLKFSSHTDTFHFEPKDISFLLLKLDKEKTSDLIQQFDVAVFYKTQKFHVSFQKQYDAQSVLKSTLELLPSGNN